MRRKSIMKYGSIVVLVLASSLVIYWIFNNSESIYTYSYGRETKFELGEIEGVFEVDVHNSTFMDEHVTFRVADKEAFLDNHVQDHENHVSSYELYTESVW